MGSYRDTGTVPIVTARACVRVPESRSPGVIRSERRRRRWSSPLRSRAGEARGSKGATVLEGLE